MISSDPASASRRTDLGWLRHRTLRSPVSARPSPAPVPAPAPPRAAPVAPVTTAAAADLDLSPPAPAAGASLDLFADEPTTSESPVSKASSGAADLLLPSRAEEPRSGRGAPAAAPGRPRRPVPRLASRGRVILTPRDPTVTLNRLQSGVGDLTVEAVCSPAVGDLTIGALYQLADGTSSIVHRPSRLAVAPPGSRRPVVTASRGEFEQLAVDLRQSRTVQRLLVYAQSGSGQDLAWGGTLVTRTFGGGRVEIPLDFGRHSGPIALMSLYNIDGEFVLRAEAEPVPGAARDVARMYGYDAITWADSHTPVL